MRALVDADIHNGWVALPPLLTHDGFRLTDAEVRRSIPDTLAVVETCLRCDGDGYGPQWQGPHRFPCTLCRTGLIQTAVATVDEVLPILAAYEKLATFPKDAIYRERDGICWQDSKYRDDITLPDATPGGVALRLTVTPCDPTPVTVHGDGPIREVQP